MKIKTSELEGAALDWAVGIALKVAPKINHQGSVDITQYSAIHIIGIACPVLWCGAYGHGSVPFSPSTDWSQGGLLIDEYEVMFDVYPASPNGYCFAWLRGKGCAAGQAGSSSSRLIAACRAIVSASLGDTVDVPDELL